MRLKTPCTVNWTRRFARPCVGVALLVVASWSTFGCSDSATVNPEVELVSLTVDPGTLRPAFAGTTTQYSVDLSNSTTSVTVRAQAAVSGDTVSIDGQTTTSRVIDLGQPVPSGSTTLVNVVVSESASSSRTYSVLIRRAALAGNNSLQNLTVSSGTLDPTFKSDTLGYEVDVTTDVTSVSITATKSDPNAVLSGDVPDQGQAIIPLGGPGTTKDVLITVTAQNGIAKTYRITIKRAAPTNNNNLSGLSLNAGSLSPPFAPSIVIYSVVVSAAVDQVTVSATKSDPNAVMAAFGSVIAPAGVPTGQATAPLGLGASTPVAIIVTAPDGSQKTYTISVFRLAR